MPRTRYFYDYSSTPERSEAHESRLTHHFRIDRENETFEIGPLEVLAPKRPLFMALTLKLLPGDVLLCWSNCSLGSTAADILQTLTLMRDKGVETHWGMSKFISSASYQVAFRMLGRLVAIEANIRSDRTSQSMKSARSAGVGLGRPTALALREPAAALDALRRLAAGETQTSVAASLGVHRRSIRRLLERQAPDLA